VIIACSMVAAVMSSRRRSMSLTGSTAANASTCAQMLPPEASSALASTAEPALDQRAAPGGSAQVVGTAHAWQPA
jgi:hypothetical protein